jgi:hypothetical protein
MASTSNLEKLFAGGGKVHSNNHDSLLRLTGSATIIIKSLKGLIILSIKRQSEKSLNAPRMPG